MTLVEYLVDQGVSTTTLDRIVAFRKEHISTDERIPAPKAFFRGPALNKFLVAVLAGYNVLLEGPKGVGKNTLIDTAAYILKRPLYQFPFNQSVDASAIVGADTLSTENGQTVVEFRKHQLVEAMEHPDGAWFVGDEINMTRADVTAVLHMATDYRRELDYPGMGRVKAHEAFRFIGTMNYGYMGTQELNEAFGDRFVVINVEPLGEKPLADFLKIVNPDLKADSALHFAKVYFALDTAAKLGSISSRAVTMRGIQQAIDLHRCGIGRGDALYMGIIAKAFDASERTGVKDVIQTCMSEGDLWFEPAPKPVVLGPDPTRIQATPAQRQAANTGVAHAGPISIDMSKIAKRRS